MARAHVLLALVLALLAASALPLQAPAARAAGTPLLVVVSTKVAVQDISTNTLRRVFQGLPTDYAPGKRFIPVNHPVGTPARVQFDRAVLALEPTDVGAYWIDRRIRDETPPPRTVPSATLALRVTASLPGAISYISPEMLNDSVRALTIDGKPASHPSYPLK
jgi:hypothetical protein